MGILQRMWHGTSAEEQLVSELSDIAGRHQELAERLARHAKSCIYPNIASGLASLAERASDHARALSAMLRERQAWSKLPKAPGADGSNNWERVRLDLALLLELTRAMNRQALQWESVDADFASLLRTIATRDDRDLGELRELALRCDPQALD
jgi:hypothetical protein